MKPVRKSNSTVDHAGKPSRRTQAERRALSEQRILDAAIRLIGQRGTTATTLGDIGEAAGYSSGLPRHLFGTKENLIVRTAQAIMELRRAHGLFALDPSGGLAALLEAGAEWFSFAVREPEVVRALLVLRSEAIIGDAAKDFPARVATVQALDERTWQHIRHFLEAGIRSGDVRSDIDLDLQPVLILSALRGIFSQWLVSPAKIDLEQAGRYWLAELERALSPTRTDGRGPARRVGRRPRQNPPSPQIASARARKRSK
jgi:AcrR family transcriptional regulator